MTIQKGQDWGRLVPRPIDLHYVADDLGASNYLNECLVLTGKPVEFAILRSGMARTIGVDGASNNKNEMLRTEFDVVEATFMRSGEVADERRYFLGHSFLSNRMCTGKVIGIFNSAHVGKRNWAPRAHPNDGNLDIIEIDDSMSIRQRIAAYRLMRSGSHLPHPKIRYRQVAEYSPDCSDSPVLFVESMRIGNIMHCVFRVVADAAILYW